MAINKTFPQAPTDLIYTALSLLQKWSVKLKEKDQIQLDKMKASILSWLSGFKPSAVLLTDIVEI
jgi:hypothetical protein